MTYSSYMQKRAIELRRTGWTHREIAKELGIGVSTAHLWCIGIELTPTQQEAIAIRRNVHHMTPPERIIASARLDKYRPTFSARQLLEKIHTFHATHGRIPLKRDFNAWHSYARLFGSWNNAIRLAGFEPNPERFARKFTAIDGHSCDSFSEKIIDDYLHSHDIPHERHVRYGSTRLTCDFCLPQGTFVEFFGLAGVQREYDRNIERKRAAARELGITLIELSPDDVYPIDGLITKLRVN